MFCMYVCVVMEAGIGYKWNYCVRVRADNDITDNEHCVSVKEQSFL